MGAKVKKQFGSNLQNTFSKPIKILSSTADNNFRGARFLIALPLCFSVTLDCGMSQLVSTIDIKPHSELLRCAWKQFDTEIVNIFVGLDITDTAEQGNLLPPHPGREKQSI